MLTHHHSALATITSTSPSIPKQFTLSVTLSKMIVVTMEEYPDVDMNGGGWWMCGMDVEVYMTV